MDLLVSGVALYTMLVTSHALLLLPDECIISTLDLSNGSGLEISRKEARNNCDMMGYFLQYFEYPLDVGGESDNDEQISKYTCCKTFLFEPEDLSCTTVVVNREYSDCLKSHEQLEKIADDCQRYSASQIPIIWHLQSDVCTADKINVRAYLCCEFVSNVPECVHNEDSCEIFMYRSDECYSQSNITRYAYDDCCEKTTELRNFELDERCIDRRTDTYLTDSYTKITYACCPSKVKRKETEAPMPRDNKCEFRHVNDYCKESRDQSQPRCTSDGSEVLSVMNEQRCHCPGGPDKALVKYACCVTNDICMRIPSDAFPSQYYFEETLHMGTDVLNTIDCHEGTLKRVCTKRGVKASWGIEKNNDCKTPDMVINEVKGITEKRKQLSGKLFMQILHQIEGVIEDAVTNKTIAKTMLSVVGNLMNIDQPNLFQAGHTGGHKVLSIVENLTSQLDIVSNDRNVVSTKDITIGVYKIVRINEPLVVRTDFEDIDTYGQTITIEGPLVTIFPDILATLREQNDRIHIISYSSPKLFVNSKSMDYSDNYSVVTVFVNHYMSFKTNQTVVMYNIPRGNKEQRTKIFACVFWDKATGNWSAGGLDLIADETGEKICRSTHLSSFYILMDTDADLQMSERDERYLTYISYIGCVVSLLGLLGTILTYVLFKSLHGDVSGKILLNICVSMLLLNVIFLLGSLDSDMYDVGICMVVGISMHYFLLTTLIWMMIEALNMYQMLIVVFAKRHRWFMQIRLLAGWGIPLAVVGITMGLSRDNYKPNNQFCFLSHTNQAAFYVAVLAPTCIILFINTCVFIRVSIIAVRTARYERDVIGSTSSISITQVRGAMSVMIVLGITWILGPLAIGPAKVLFAYMFTILNSIQGFLVFVFRCLLNNEARLSWEYLLTSGRRKRKRGSHPSASNVTWTKSTENSKTKKYTNVSVSNSDLSSRTRCNFPDNQSESGTNATDGLDCEIYTELKPDKNIGHMGYRGGTDESSKRVRLKYNDVNLEDTQSKRNTMGATHDHKQQQIVSKMENKQINAIDTQSRSSNEAESKSVPRWLSTSKTSIQSEMAKMKCNRYELSTSGISPMVVPQHLVRTSKTSLGQQSAHKDRKAHDRDIPVTSEVLRHATWFSASKTSLKSELAKMKVKRYCNKSSETSRTIVST